MTGSTTVRFEDVDESFVDQLLPQYKPVQFVNRGGQKRVFKCMFQNETWALKLHLVSDASSGSQSDIPSMVNSDESETEPVLDQVTARARREVLALSECNTPHLPKVGPLGLQTLEYQNLSLLYYLEEFLDGVSVRDQINACSLPVGELRMLGLHVAKAIEALWNCGDGKHPLVHRDIKPANIMKRVDGSYVLIDIGLAFDVFDISLTDPGQVPGTAPYMSPDQLDYPSKRSMDFRTDMFCLGVVLYEAATQMHPFLRPGMSASQLYTAIVRTKPEPIEKYRQDIPSGLADVINRLLAKRPHLRYRKCVDLIRDLETQ